MNSSLISIVYSRRLALGAVPWLYTVIPFRTLSVSSSSRAPLHHFFFGNCSVRIFFFFFGHSLTGNFPRDHHLFGFKQSVALTSFHF